MPTHPPLPFNLCHSERREESLYALWAVVAPLCLGQALRLVLIRPYTPSLRPTPVKPRGTVKALASLSLREGDRY